MPFLFTTRSGRILQASDPMINMLGSDPVGRNLNDLVSDSTAAEILLNASAKAVYTLECEINGCYCTCGAQLTKDDRISLVFTLQDDRRDPTNYIDLIRYLGRGIIENASSLTYAAAALKGTENGAQIDKNLMNLIRIARNAVSKLDFQSEGLTILPRVGNLTDDLTDICNRAAKVLTPYADVRVNCSAKSVLCLYDADALFRAVLNVIHHAIAHSPLSRPQLSIHISHIGKQILLQFQSNGKEERFHAPSEYSGHIPNYGDGLELEVASMLFRSQKGTLVTGTTDNNIWFCNATMPIVPPNEDQELAHTIIDWYGGRDPILFELSGILPAEAYHINKKV